MITNPVKWIIIMAAMALFACPTLAQGTAFTYQGRLEDGGAPAGGMHDFQFRLFDGPVGGAQVGQTQCGDNVAVGDGLFTVQLDFGQQNATAVQRHLEIAVRTDAGLLCSDSSGYVVLSPRQQLTATPLASHAESAFALDAADGSPVNAVFVDNAGNVGIGTAVPGFKLDVSDRLRVRQGSPPSANNTAGIWLWQDGAGDRAFVGMRDSNTVGMFGVGGGWSVQMNTTTGNLGIGTEVPAAKLDVRGDIRLGPTGQLRATSSEENLRIVRGVVTAAGAIITGSGFSVSHPSTGRYSISFNTPFAGLPTVTATPDIAGTDIGFVMTEGVLAGTANLLVIYPGGVGAVMDLPFHFIAIGPR